MSAGGEEPCCVNVDHSPVTCGNMTPPGRRVPIEGRWVRFSAVVRISRLPICSHPVLPPLPGEAVERPRRPPLAHARPLRSSGHDLVVVAEMCCQVGDRADHGLTYQRRSTWRHVCMASPRVARASTKMLCSPVASTCSSIVPRCRCHLGPEVGSAAPPWLTPGLTPSSASA